jgi:hypothetical protein
VSTEALPSLKGKIIIKLKDIMNGIVDYANEDLSAKVVVESLSEMVLTEAISNCYIHPNSMFRAHWNMFFTFLLFLAFVAFPPITAYSEDTMIYTVSLATLIAFVMLDMLVNMITGYEENGKYVLKPRSIIKHYFKSHFLIDALFFIIFLGMFFDSLSGEEHPTPLFISNGVVFLKYVHISHFIAALLCH